MRIQSQSVEYCQLPRVYVSAKPGAPPKSRATWRNVRVTLRGATCQSLIGSTQDVRKPRVKRSLDQSKLGVLRASAQGTRSGLCWPLKTHYNPPSRRYFRGRPVTLNR